MNASLLRSDGPAVRGSGAQQQHQQLTTATRHDGADSFAAELSAADQWLTLDEDGPASGTPGPFAAEERNGATNDAGDATAQPLTSVAPAPGAAAPVLSPIDPGLLLAQNGLSVRPAQEHESGSPGHATESASRSAAAVGAAAATAVATAAAAPTARTVMTAAAAEIVPSLRPPSAAAEHGGDLPTAPAAAVVAAATTIARPAMTAAANAVGPPPLDAGARSSPAAVADVRGASVQEWVWPPTPTPASRWNEDA